MNGSFVNLLIQDRLKRLEETPQSKVEKMGEENSIDQEKEEINNVVEKFKEMNGSSIDFVQLQEELELFLKTLQDKENFLLNLQTTVQNNETSLENHGTNAEEAEKVVMKKVSKQLKPKTKGLKT